MTPADARNKIAEIRPEVRKGASKLLAKFRERISFVESLKLLWIVMGVLGALVAGISRGIDGPLGFGLTIGGVTATALSGIAIGFLDRRKLEISQDAADAHEKSDAALDLAESLVSTLETSTQSVEAFDRKRRERLLAGQKMIEVLEASLVTGSGDVERTAEAMLRAAIQSIRSAVEYKGSDFFTLTIFRRVQEDGNEVMRRIAAQWTDPALAAKGGRDWHLGQGYTGVAWQNGLTNPNGDVIIGDTQAPGVPAQYPVPKPDPQREALYRSVASIPILVKSQNEVWGVVTATTDRPNVFVRDMENLKVQNVEMIRDVARIAALLAGVR